MLQRDEEKFCILLPFLSPQRLAAINPKHQNLLQEAIEYNKLTAVQLLLNNPEIDTNLADARGHRPIVNLVTKLYKHDSASIFLLMQNKRFELHEDVLCELIRHPEWAPSIEFLFYPDNPIKVIALNLRTPDGQSLLHKAIQANNHLIANLLLQHPEFFITADEIEELMASAQQEVRTLLEAKLNSIVKGH